MRPCPRAPGGTHGGRAAAPSAQAIRAHAGSLPGADGTRMGSDRTSLELAEVGLRPASSRRSRESMPPFHLCTKLTCDGGVRAELRSPCPENKTKRADPVGPGPSRGRAPCGNGRVCPRPCRLRSVYAWCVVGAALLLQAPAASAYLIKSSLYWERVGAFPHYLTTPPGGVGASWPKSGLCYNGPGCGKNTPEYRCNPDCGNPNIGIKDSTKYPKAFLIRFVSLYSIPSL